MLNIFISHINILKLFNGKNLIISYLASLTWTLLGSNQCWVILYYWSKAPCYSMPCAASLPVELAP
jgi:hypothetical protein